MKSIGLLFLAAFCFAYGKSQVTDSLLNPLIENYWYDPSGRQVLEVVVPGVPPDFYRSPIANPTENAVMLDSVPAYSWSFGCSSTTAAMQAGYYDIHGFQDVYSGPANGGVIPMDNTVWGSVTINGETRSQCPLSATMMGLDQRPERGHVDDFWVIYRHYGPDPYLANGWQKHPDGECTGDFMGTNQSALGNQDGSTRFFFTPDGSALNDYTGNEPLRRDGCHGIRLFYESRGYEVLENYTQLIQGMYGNTIGFTFQQYLEEIDNGRPVILQLTGHNMLGVGYDDSGGMVFLHDTWDNSVHSMNWGGSYAGMAHWGVTVIRLEDDNSSPQSDFSASMQSICAGHQVQFTDLTTHNPTSWLWTFQGGQPTFSTEQNPVASFALPGSYSVTLRTTNQYGYDTEKKFNFILVGDSCYCTASGSESWINGIRIGNITLDLPGSETSGYGDFSEFETEVYEGQLYPLLVFAAGDPDLPSCCTAWIDWNRDLDFEDSTETCILSHIGGGLFSTLIRIPSNYSEGALRLRIRVGNPALSPCGNGNGGEVEDYTLINRGLSQHNELSLRFFIQGLFDANSHSMNKASVGGNGVFTGEVCDIIDVGLAAVSDPNQIIGLSRNTPFYSDGSCLAVFPASIADSVYIVLKYRNGMETWSSKCIVFNGGAASYSFGDNPANAFGSNVIILDGTACIISGDVDQDGIIDSGDLINMENLVTAFSTGYFPEDTNGDGLIDSTDWIIEVENVEQFFTICRP